MTLNKSTACRSTRGCGFLKWGGQLCGAAAAAQPPRFAASSGTTNVRLRMIFYHIILQVIFGWRSSAVRGACSQVSQLQPMQDGKVGNQSETWKQEKFAENGRRTSEEEKVQRIPISSLTIKQKNGGAVVCEAPPSLRLDQHTHNRLIESLLTRLPRSFSPSVVLSFFRMNTEVLY